MNARRRVVRAGLGIAAIAATLLTSACAAGQKAMTANEYSVISGQNADLGQIGIRNIVVAAPNSGSYAVGDSAPLSLILVNTGHADDELASVSSSAFSSATQTSIAVPAGKSVQVGVGDSATSLELNGLTQDGAGDDNGLFPGESIPVTLTFQSAGTVTVQVPVALGESSSDHASVPAPSPTETETPE